MDFDLNDDQQAILEAVDGLLARHAGPERAVALRGGGYDHELDTALHESGFSEVALADGTGLLEAALVSEAVARAGGVVATGASAVVAAGLLSELPDGPVALASVDTPGPVRFAAHARTLLVSDGDVARRVPLAEGSVEPVASNFGYPLGRITESHLSAGEALGAGSGLRLRNLWRLALAIETAGTMRAALSVTCAYLKQRRQFGKHIGSFQAVQHRLAECAIEIEASRWLALEAAYHDAPREAAAIAATYALEAADRVFAEMHQLSGAIGFTREHDLHVWSMRLPALRLELGGVAKHGREVAAARWSASP
jgi:alkylation response protein AidB-like acyl-CoA dehydrogenase